MEKPKNTDDTSNVTTAAKAIVTNPLFILLSTLITVITISYHFGYNHASAQKDKEIAVQTMEFTTKLIELDRQHREETNAKDSQINEYRERMWVHRKY